MSVDGRYVRLDRVALDWPPARRPPLLLGARGPKSLALAGEIADGVLLDSITGADVVRRGRAAVDEARAAAGRDGRAQVSVYTGIDPAQDPAGLADRVADWAAELGEAGADTVIVFSTGSDPDPRPLIEAVAG